MDSSQHKEYFLDSTYTFFTLPPELRCKIYNFLMNDPVESEFAEPGYAKVLRIEPEDNHGHRLDTWFVQRKSLSSQLLRTSKHIYKEAVPILYRAWTLLIRHHGRVPAVCARVGILICSHITEVILEKQHLPGDTLKHYAVRQPPDWAVYFEDFNQTPKLPKLLFQDLPALKTATLLYDFYHSYEVRDGGLQALIGRIWSTEPKKNHFLCHLKATTPQHRPSVAWRLYACSNAIQVPTGERYEQYRVKVQVDVVYENVGGKTVRKWRFVDMLGSVKNNVVIQRREG